MPALCRGRGERGVIRKVIEEVWQMMMGFDGYSFCKPHSASYTTGGLQVRLSQGPLSGRIHGLGHFQRRGLLLHLRVSVRGKTNGAYDPAPGYQPE